MRQDQIERFLEAVPGSISWFILILISALFIFKPIAVAIVLIAYLIYWLCRLLYMSTLLALAHRRVSSAKNTDWLALCRNTASDKKFEDIIHIVLYTVYKEPYEVIRGSLEALAKVNYPRDKIIVALAGEGRDAGSSAKLGKAKEEFIKYFRDIVITIHPAGAAGEIPCKGANATFAASKIKELLEKEGLPLENVVISSFDADTCPDKDYFSCLTYNFLSNPKRYQTSFQPLPIYNNNIYYVPAFARVMELGSTFWQMIESMRYEKIITFSSHSMSFKTLVDVGYWPVNLVSDDSLIFWKCFLHFNGDYSTDSLEAPVYMDIAVGKNFLDTIAVQYRQKRRWAWGVETFVFLGMGLLHNRNIPLAVKIRRLYQILDNHINWATWSIIISFITPLVLLWSRFIRPDSLIFFNLSYINSAIFNSLILILFLCIFISRGFVPPRPENVPRRVYISFILQWFFIPFVSAFLGSLPALDAQTRLMFNSRLGFYATPKKRMR
ncbi:MAG: glycosyltransferase family 2 protein [Candidatus Omnitrophota bacterium]|jgi:hypothetical protein